MPRSFDFGKLIWVHPNQFAKIMELPTFLMESNPPTFSVLIVIFAAHILDGRDTGEKVCHKTNQCVVAEPDDEGSINTVEQYTRILRREHRRFSFLNVSSM